MVEINIEKGEGNVWLCVSFQDFFGVQGFLIILPEITNRNNAHMHVPMESHLTLKFENLKIMKSLFRACLSGKLHGLLVRARLFMKPGGPWYKFLLSDHLLDLFSCVQVSGNVL